MDELAKRRHTFNANPRMKTVLVPLTNAREERNYVLVPAIETRGTWRVIDMIDDDLKLHMAVYAEWLSKGAPA